MQKDGAVEKYEESEKIATLFQQYGVSAVAALCIKSRFVQIWENEYFIVYPFLDGNTLPLDEINLIQATIVGDIFKKMHSLRLTLPLSQATPHYHIFDDAHWIKLIDEYKNPELLQLSNVLLDWNQKYRACIERLDNDILISHRDLHSSNVLWKGNVPYVLDWESAGYTNPMQEIIGFGLEWSGIISSYFDLDRFNAIMNSYQFTTRKFNFSYQDSFFGWLGNSVMGWLEFNLRRAKDNLSTREEQEKGVKIIQDTMVSCLRFINLNMDQIMRSIEKATIG